MSSQCLDRFRKHDLLLIQFQIALLFGSLSDFLAGDCSEQAAALADLYLQGNGLRGDHIRKILRSSQLLSGNLGFISLLLLQLRQVLGSGFHAKLLRENKVSGIAIIYLNYIALLAKGLYIFK